MGRHPKTTEQFIKDAKRVHGDKYKYDLVEYIDSKTPVDIVCPEHGVFSQIPNNHLAGSGCRKCYDERLQGSRGPRKRNMKRH